MGAMLGSAAQSTTTPPPLSPPPASAALAATSTSSTPPPARTKGPVFNVYAQEIDPANMMPVANNAMAPGQASPLPVERVKSTIPKGGVDGHWLYPSPQMFYNSLVRKNKADGVDVNEVPLVVQIHNEMNERTWSQLLEWESSHTSEHLPSQPALRRFMGNPYELSPKSRIKSWLGMGFPFDRHDWYVDRGGRSVHYIIDYFYNPSGSAVSPKGPRAPLTGSIHVDVRPAVEDVTSFIDRLSHFPSRMIDALSRPRFVAEGIDPSKADPALIEEAKRHVCESNKAAAAADKGENIPVQAPPPLKPTTAASSSSLLPSSSSSSSSSALTPAERQWADMDVQCAPLLHALKTSSDEDRAGKHVALNYCMGRVLCPDEAGDFLKQLELAKKDGNDGAAGGGEENAFNTMTQCIMRAGKRRQQATPLR